MVSGYNGNSSDIKQWEGLEIRDKQTLYQHVYQDLKEQIRTGRVRYGEKLPSMSGLCDFYHVGLRTVRDVLRTLKEEGYICTEERKAATVLYRQPDCQESDSAIRSVLGRKKLIVNVHRAITILMPPIIAFSSQCLNQEELKQWLQALTRSRFNSPEIRWRTCSKLLYSLLEHSKNLLFRDMFISFELYGRLPFFQSQKRYLELFAKRGKFRGTVWVMESLLTQDPSEITARFTDMFQRTTAAVEEYLDELSQEFPELPDQEDVSFLWAPERGRDHYYTQITRDLVDKIGNGYYQAGNFLPSEAALSREYGVCVSTVRKAIAMLNELGFGETRNAQGTRIILPGEEATLRCMKSKTYKRDTLLYLSGLQLMAIAVRPAALLAYPHITSEARKALQNRLQDPTLFPLDEMIHLIIASLPLPPLGTVLTEVGKLLYWGYYYSFFPNGVSNGNPLSQKSHGALVSFLAGDAEGFAGRLSACYCYVLEFIRPFMIENGLPEAAGILTPGESLCF